MSYVRHYSLLYSTLTVIPSHQLPMFKTVHFNQHRLASTAAMWQALCFCASRGWRGWVAAITAITFVLLVSAAATHDHTTSLEEQACSICHVAAQKLINTDTALPIAQILVFLAYHLPTLGSLSVVTVSPLLLPPSCGPPVLSSSCLQ